MAFHVCYDDGHFCDSFDAPTLDQAKDSCLEVLVNWVSSFFTFYGLSSGSDLLHADQSVRDSWDSMIEECSVYVCDDNDPEWYSCYAPEGD